MSASNSHGIQNVANLDPGMNSDLRPDRKWPEFVTVVGNDSEAATKNDYLGGENLVR